MKEFYNKKYEILNQSVDQLLKSVNINFKNKNDPKYIVDKKKWFYSTKLNFSKQANI